MRHTYPSDITREQFEAIRPTLESARGKTKPRKLDLYDIFCAILYLLKSGCQWNMLPSDFPKKGICYYYLQIWREKENETTDSILESALKKSGIRMEVTPLSKRKNQHGCRRFTKR